MDYTDFEPIHQHDIVNDLWEYERPMMSVEELLHWSKAGYTAHLNALPEDALKRRYNQFLTMLDEWKEG